MAIETMIFAIIASLTSLAAIQLTIGRWLLDSWRGEMQAQLRAVIENITWQFSASEERSKSASNTWRVRFEQVENRIDHIEAVLTRKCADCPTLLALKKEEKES
jgi:hypothetical protein